MTRNPKQKKVARRAREARDANAAPAAPPPTQQQPKVWQPGDDVEDGEELQYDPTAYDCLHTFNLGWPCLSFDIIQDSLGAERREFPHTLFFVAGTQADVSSNNSVAIVRLCNITGKKRKSVPANDEESSGSDSDSDEEGDDDPMVSDSSNQSKAPAFQSRMVAHQGCVNRIRAMPQQPHIVGTWSDTGYVQIWDMANQLRALTDSPAESTSTAPPPRLRQAPVHICTDHKDEGYAIDWSSVALGRLLTGDCRSVIYLWEPTPDGKWNVDRAPFQGHTGSVEDIQWSPTEATVFASCSSDRSLKIWDTRQHGKPAFDVQAHEADVNVISWNRMASCMIASGSDDGSFRVWDLRSLSQGNSVVAQFAYHKGPITSIEWSPGDSSMLGLTSSDNHLSIWDLSLERDAEEEAEFQANLATRVEAPADVPQQYLFGHMGQKDLKEMHWHPQIKGMIVSTASDGFNVFIPSNLENVSAN